MRLFQTTQIPTQNINWRVGIFFNKNRKKKLKIATLFLILDGNPRTPERAQMKD